MKNNLKLFVPVLLAFLIGSLTFAFAQTNGVGKSRLGSDAARGEDGFHFGGLPPHVLAQLNLTDAQRTQIDALQTAAQTAAASYVEAIRAADTQLRTLSESGTFNDEAQARAILATRAQASIEFDIIRLRLDAAIYNLLTAEQRTLLAELRQRHGGSPRGRRHDAPSQN